MSEWGAKGIELQIGDGGGTEVFTAIAQVRDVGGPGLSMDTIDVTHHGSADHWREFVAGLKDAGEVSLELLFDPTETTHRDASGGLLDDMDNRVLRNFQLQFPDTAQTTWSFAAFVTGFNPSAPHDGALTAAVTLKISGEPTLA
ncbi:MAG: phage tail tube protein [Gemmatimonadota bacterium]